MSRHHRRHWRSSRVQKLRLAILERDGWRCQIGDTGCTGTATAVDHIVPLSQGGDPTNPANLRAACRTCNAKRNRRAANIIDLEHRSPRW